VTVPVVSETMKTPRDKEVYEAFIFHKYQKQDIVIDQLAVELPVVVS
jgi:hypothetical protein